jgi:hypothetical protein
MSVVKGIYWRAAGAYAHVSSGQRLHRNVGRKPRGFNPSGGMPSPFVTVDVTVMVYPFKR